MEEKELNPPAAHFHETHLWPRQTAMPGAAVWLWMAWLLAQNPNNKAQSAAVRR